MNDLSGYDVRIISRSALVALARAEINTDLSVVATVGAGGASTRYVASVENHRIRSCIKYVDDLFKNHGPRVLAPDSAPFAFALEGADLPADISCVSWQRKKTYSRVCLVPDFYYTLAQGYRDFQREGVLPWDARKTIVFWRGSTTGGFNTTLETLEAIPRFKLCAIAKTLGHYVDVGFYDVVQAASEADASLIKDHLIARDMFRTSVPMEVYQTYKFMIQMDGNGNSWELVRKLRLGCCMLLVDSDWVLWHNARMREWVHYVPVRKDLTDLRQKIEWCLHNDDEAREIARRARDFAIGIDYDEEMRAAVRLIQSHAGGHAIGSDGLLPEQAECLDADKASRTFRALLGRSPETPDVVRHLTQYPDEDALVDALESSEEFRWRSDWLRPPLYSAVFDPIKYILRNEDVTRSVDPGAVVNYFGVRFDPDVVGPLVGGKGDMQDAPIPANWHAEVAEFGAVMRSVDLAGDHFTMVELGCGWGCWLTISGVAARRSGRRPRLIGVEKQSAELAKARHVLVRNGFSEDQYRLLHGGLSTAREPAHLAEAVRDGLASDHTLQDVFAPHERIDLLHLDVQGDETRILLSDLATLRQRVAYIVVGTHSREIDGQLMGAFLDAGWLIEVERPTTIALKGGRPSVTMDGLQAWRNPDLT